MGAVLTFLSTLFVFSVVNGTPLLYGTLGEILTEKSGNMNLGVEGILFMGGAAGLGGAFYYEKLAGANASPFVALLLAVFFAFLAGALASLLFSFITITLRANQNVTGLALTIFGTGAGQFLGEYMRVQEGSYVSLSNNLKAIFVNSPFPAFLRNIPVLGPLLFQHNILTYFALALAVFLAWFLNKTRKGLYLRAVGESPATADAAGINVTRYKYLATVLGGGISAIGGVAYITGIAGVESRGSVRRRLAGCRARHLLPLEAVRSHLGQHPVRLPAEPVPAPEHSVHSLADLQDPAVHRHGGCAHLQQSAQQPRKAAARRAGRPLLPRGALSLPKPTCAASQSRDAARFFVLQAAALPGILLLCQPAGSKSAGRSARRPKCQAIASAMRSQAWPSP